VAEFTRVREDDLPIVRAGYGKADGIPVAVWRKMRAFRCISEIAEFVDLGV
jgi:hypothetical protein